MLTLLAGPLNSPETLFGGRYVPRYVNPVAERNMPRFQKEAYLDDLKRQAEEQRAQREAEKAQFTGIGYRPNTANDSLRRGCTS